MRPLALADCAACEHDADHAASLLPAKDYDHAAALLAVFDAEAALVKWCLIVEEIRPEALPRSVRDLLGFVRTARASLREVTP